MKLSIWHCKVLYILSRLELAKVAETGEVSLSLLTQTAKVEEWKPKKDKYHSLPESKKQDLDVIELLAGDFKSNPSHVEYVELVLKKVKAKSTQQTKESVIDQFANRLGDFGMDKENAKKFMSQIQKELNEHPSESESAVNIAQETEISIQEKIDTINAGYRFLVAAQSQTAADLHDDLRENINFISSMMKDIRSKMPSGMGYEELITSQRYLNYGFTSLHKLMQLQYELSGVKAHVNHQSQLSKLFGAGYNIIRRDEMGRLIGDAN